MDCRQIVAGAWKRMVRNYGLAVAALALLSGCGGGLQGVSQPAGKGYAVFYATIITAGCITETIEFAQPQGDGLRSVTAGTVNHGMFFHANFVVVQLSAGTYEIVRASCVRSDHSHYYVQADLPKGSELFSAPVFMKSLGRFTVGPDEVVDIGDLSFLRTSDGAATLGVMTVGNMHGLEQFKAKHPELAARLIVRHAVPASADESLAVLQKRLETAPAYTTAEKALQQRALEQVLEVRQLRPGGQEPR